MDLMEFFKDEAFCHNFLKDLFWGANRENMKCPICESKNVMEFENFKKNRCYDCKFDFSIRKNTIFDDSKISLRKWFMVIYLANTNTKGVSSVNISKQVGITQKTAWFMLQRIKNASMFSLFDNRFEGTIEIDETYIAGLEKNRHLKHRKEGIKDKAVVFGMVNRDTKQVKAMKVNSAEKESLLPQININVKKYSVIVTDTHHAYNGLKINYTHKTIKHSFGEYSRIEKDNQGRVSFKIHTNSIEGFWSIAKRTIHGTHNWISKKHINKYLGDMSFRYNTSDMQDNTRFINFLQLSFVKLTYKELIAYR